MVYVTCMTTDSRSELHAIKRTLIDALYRKYQRALVHFLSRQRLDRDDVADIVQETYSKLHDYPVESIQSPKAFLFRVASNLANNGRKRRKFIGEHGEINVDGSEICSEVPSPSRSLQSQQELALVRMAFEELSPKCKVVFVMNRFEDMKYLEIAQELNISVSMVEKYISQALAHLKLTLVDARSPAGGRLLLKRNDE